MSMNNLSVDGEFRYIIQWFNEWSELQRDDFVYVLVEYLKKTTVHVGDAGANGYVNGVVNSLASTGLQDKPMSLFQCRIKLFREWSVKWPLDFKGKLQEKINEIDAKVGEKIINELKGSHAEHNGDIAVHLNVNGASSLENGEVEHTAETLTTAVAAAVDNDVTLETDNDNRLAAVLRQETPVDDDDDNDNEDGKAEDDCNADINGHNASSAVTTIAVNTSPQPTVGEPVEQVENNVTASVIVSVPAAATATAAGQAEVPPVA